MPFRFALRFYLAVEKIELGSILLAKLGNKLLFEDRTGCFILEALEIFVFRMGVACAFIVCVCRLCSMYIVTPSYIPYDLGCGA